MHIYAARVVSAIQPIFCARKVVIRTDIQGLCADVGGEVVLKFFMLIIPVDKMHHACENNLTKISNCVNIFSQYVGFM